jgi:hypothetical protein
MATRRVGANGTSEIAMFGRIIGSESGDLPRSLARYILTLGFGKKDQARMLDLAERNQHAQLTGEEREELDNFVKAGHLLALLHSKARKSLRRKKVS